MENNALTAGVSPDGLKNRRDIKILVCFLLNTAAEPLAREDLTKIMCDKCLANYFEICDAIDRLIKNGNVLIDNETGFLSLSADGKTVAENLYDDLPLTVREKATATAMKLIARRRSERENRVEITKCDGGCKVECTLMSGDLALMSVSLYVPDKRYASKVREQFLDNPESIYRTVLSQMTGERDLAPHKGS